MLNTNAKKIFQNKFIFLFFIFALALFPLSRIEAVDYTVTATAGANGAISPASRTVTSPATTTFTVTPDDGYTALVSGCDGSLVGSTYTTGAITANCAVSATFILTGVPACGATHYDCASGSPASEDEGTSSFTWVCAGDARLPAPTGLTTVPISRTQIDLSWTNTHETAQTRIYRKGVLIATVGAGITSYSSTGLVKSTSYTYKVSHYINPVESPFSNNSTAVTLSTYNDDAPPVISAFDINPKTLSVGLGSGGTITTDGAYTVHTFNASGTFNPGPNITSVDYLVVGGGGGGGHGTGGSGAGAGGGAGGALFGTKTVVNQNYTVTVGAGGLGSSGATGWSATNGSNSVFDNVTAIGGGRGAGIYGYGPAPLSGGSGGGSCDGVGAAGTSGQGYKGGNTNYPYGCGGGGGAGGAGQGGGAGMIQGGIGITWNGLKYAGGGSSNYNTGGGSEQAVPYGGGYSTGNHGDAVDGTGGGGGVGYGAEYMPPPNETVGVTHRGGNGGRGVVVIRYLTPKVTATFTATDTGGSNIQKAVLMRAVYQESLCTVSIDTGCSWTAMTELTAPSGADVWNGSSTPVSSIEDYPSTVSYIYGLLVYDNAGNIGYEPARVQVDPIASTSFATGGTITNSGAYTIHTFTSSGTFTPNKNGVVEYLVVGGGGGGGFGGGGAGGLRTGTLSLTPGAKTVTVGSGGAANTAGGSSAFDTITAAGGGYGGNTTNSTNSDGGNGGSGGGAATNSAGTVLGTVGAGNTPSTSPSQGNNGGLGTNTGGYGKGGGGGAGAVGGAAVTTTGGAGGAGVVSSINGSSVTYAGGGGGGASNGAGAVGGAGGAGGGGNGGSGVDGSGTAGTANRGGGGGGKSGPNGAGGAGGSGIVIVRYLTPEFTAPVISAFDVQPRITSSNTTATFTATDSGGSYLQKANLMRSPYNASNCTVSIDTGCSWTVVSTLNAPASANTWNSGSTPASSFTESPALGSYIYGLQVFDNSGNIGFEPTRIKVDSTAPAYFATGGTITTSGAYTIHTFTTSGTFTPSDDISVEYLVVAGGGGGGGYAAAAGGGAGGLLQGTQAVTAQAYTVTIGAGGTAGPSDRSAKGGNGGNSVFGALTAVGGGGGGRGWIFEAGNTGGSAGGASGGDGISGALFQASVSGTAGQGYAGGGGWKCSGNSGVGGGGGGAGANGGTPDCATRAPKDGGVGIQSSISGTATYYAGGGAGSSYNANNCGTGGLGGGGACGTAGTANRGGGGGGASALGNGGAGGSGIVIIRYITPEFVAPTISAFDVTPRIATGAVTATFTATDSGGSYLKKADLMRATYNPVYCTTSITVGCIWSVVGTLNAPASVNTWNSGSTPAASIANTPTTGSYVYGIQVYDNYGNIGYEPARIKVDVPQAFATGGTITTSGNYTIHTFTSSGTFTPNRSGYVEYLVVGGGGGGGSSIAGYNCGGGGGAGGLRTAAGYYVTAQDYSVTVGEGGRGGVAQALEPGVNGQNSAFGSIVSLGGGGGANISQNNASVGGSGGGAGWYSPTYFAAGTPGQGYAGGAGGGGGAGGAAGAAGSPGIGITTTITGSSLSLAGGGYTCSSWSNSAYGGGAINANGVANTGSGGGGGYDVSAGGAGGKGIVIIRYLTTQDTQAPTVSAFDVQPRTTTGAVTATFTATDTTGGSYLQKANLMRAPYNASVCTTSYAAGCSWSVISTLNAPATSNTWNSGSTPASTFSDTPVSGSYIYGVQVYDNYGNIGYEPARIQVDSVVPLSATGGTITTSGNYTVHTFTTSGTFTSNRAGIVEVLVVAGGGGGGSSVTASGGGGGGGAGGLIYDSDYAVSTSPITVTVGNGGNPGTAAAGQDGTAGQNSVFGSLTAIGGGYGGKNSAGPGGAGGSGGGGGYNSYSTPRAGGAGTAGQGYAGGTTFDLTWAGGAGGGGAGGVGGTNKTAHGGGDRGPGVAYTISGSSVTYSTGGSGGSNTPAASPANTGKGGDAAYATGTAYAGGSGVVIVRYPTTPDTTNPTISSFDVQPRTTAGTVTATFIATDAGDSNIQKANLMRSPYNASTCTVLIDSGCVWSTAATLDAPYSVSTWNSGSTPAASIVDVPISGSYIYGLQVFDNAGNIGFEATRIKVDGTAYASGGTMTTSGPYTIHTFTSSGTFTPSASVTSVEYLVVAGGGGGASSGGGGGGAGGFRTGTDLAVSAQAYPVTVGAGGRAFTNGSDSVFSSITSVGGGAGGGKNTNGSTGGSGGGAGNKTSAATGGAPTSGQGYAGGANGIYVAPFPTGGGGGAGAVGGTGTATTSGSGGAGLASSITGSSVTYAGGGGGFPYTAGTAGTGGAGGGGAGHATAPVAGTANTGGGGGGGGSAGVGATGGSGIVVIRYYTPEFTAPTVSAFDVQPRASSGTVTATYTTTDSGGSYLKKAELVRANYNASNCTVSVVTGCSWSVVGTLNAPASTNTWNSGSTPPTSIGDTLSVTASYIYGIQVYDNYGNIGYEPARIKVDNTGVFSATGGTITTSGGYTLHTFTTSGTFTPSASANVEVLVVAAGGGGGGGIGAGGGAGGLIYNSSYAVTASPVTVTVGTGGSAGAAAASGGGGQGGNSVFGTITAIGGGGGSGQTSGGPTTGGSGGGSSNQLAGAGAAGTAGQGYAGGDGLGAAPNYGGGGGGGAGAVGGNGSATAQGNGGVGLQYSQFSSVGGYPAGWFAGGGGGGSYQGGTQGLGGSGGGGNGGATAGGDAPGSPGVANTGGGGGAGHYSSSHPGGGMGGSGVVIVRYVTPELVAPTVSAFDVQPRTSTGSVTATFTATDSGGSYLQKANLMRSPYNASTCTVSVDSGCSWSIAATLNAPATVNTWNSGSTPAASIVNSSIPTGSYIYGLTVYDNYGNIGYEPARIQVNNTLAFSATGGTITTAGGYTIHTFTTSGTFTPNQSGAVEYLVIGGGGGGGTGEANAVGDGGGGGGAGGYRAGTGFAVTAQAYSITVGTGGAGATAFNTNGTKGNDSIFSTITATGGGYGSRDENIGGSGGSGGGGGGLYSGTNPAGGAGNTPSTSPSQGNTGGSGIANMTSRGGGGGGGSGSVGGNSTSTTGGAGGSGTASSINGSSVTRAGGGGGGTGNSGGTGGSATGGGGAGGAANAAGSAGTANTGGGGGGAGANSTTGGTGGSGVVIIKYLTP